MDLKSTSMMWSAALMLEWIFCITLLMGMNKRVCGLTLPWGREVRAGETNNYKHVIKIVFINGTIIISARQSL